MKETKAEKKQSESSMRVCEHGSIYCGICKHNLASAMALPGRPKYVKGVKQSKKPKGKVREVQNLAV